jgi:hypothetical protein
MKFGATVPPQHGGGLPTNNSDTGDSTRYCMHKIICRHYIKSKSSGNTVDFETESHKELEAYLHKLKKMPGGIKNCGVCLKEYN